MGDECRSAVGDQICLGAAQAFGSRNIEIVGSGKDHLGPAPRCEGHWTLAEEFGSGRVRYFQWPPTGSGEGFCYEVAQRVSTHARIVFAPDCSEKMTGGANDAALRTIRRFFARDMLGNHYEQKHDLPLYGEIVNPAYAAKQGHVPYKW